MKRLICLFIVGVCSAILLNAEDQNMISGWVCDSKCVVESGALGNRTTCDPTCSERSGNAVFIEDGGTVTKISNPEFCASHMNQRVSATATKANNEANQEQMRVDVFYSAYSEAK